MAYWYGLIDDVLYNSVNQNCNLSYWDFDAGKLSDDCKRWMNNFDSKISGINHYDFLGKCYIEPQPSALNAPSFQPSERILQEGAEITRTFTVNDYTPFVSSLSNEDTGLQLIPNCVYALPVYYYLNNRTIMDALHIPKTVTQWDLCKEKGDLSYTKSREGSIGIYSLIKDKYKILVYSGDTDGSVPTYGTKAWIESLGWPISKQYKQFVIDE
jgi:hypothetical protein